MAFLAAIVYPYQQRGLREHMPHSTSTDKQSPKHNCPETTTQMDSIRRRPKQPSSIVQDLKKRLIID